MAWREEKKLDKWTVPYLPIDPKDVGRTYEADVIRINSQSGKGGVAYILKQSFGINVPQQMREQVGYMVKQVSDEEHKELSPGGYTVSLQTIMWIFIHISLYRSAILSR